MKSKFWLISSFLMLSSLAISEDFKPRSPDSEKTKSGISTAKVVLVGNDEPWLEICVPIVELDRDRRNTTSEQGKLVRIPIHRAVAWNSKGERLRDDSITETFLEPKRLYVDDLLVQSKRATMKRVYINERVVFDRYDEYRKFQLDGVRNPRVETKIPPIGSVDTGEYFVSFESPVNPEPVANSIWLFLPPEVFDESKLFNFPSDAMTDSALKSHRIWQDRSGRFRVYAQVSEYDDEIVKLRKADGSIVSVPISKLSTDDQAIIYSALRKRLLSRETPQVKR